MSSNHHLSDFISSVNNAGAVGKPFVLCPYSKVIQGVCDCLLNEGFIKGYEVLSNESSPNVKRIRVDLKYYRCKHVVSDFRVVSRPGSRVYWGIDDFKIKSFYDGFGHYVVTTSKGIIVDRVAKEMGIGGEVLCEVF